MNAKEFLSKYLVTIGSSILSIVVLHGFLGVGDEYMLSGALVVAFAVMTPVVYHFAKKYARSARLIAFTQFALLVSFNKMLVSILIFVIYAMEHKEEARVMVWPFLVVYVGFTIFETHFMMKLGQPKKL